MKQMKKLSLLTLFAALMVFMAACGGGASTDKTEGTASKETPKTEENERTFWSLSISGSSAMQPLVAAAAEEFMATKFKC